MLREDGTEFLAYSNPRRRYGSLHVPAWPEFVRERTRTVWDRPDVAAIFFDNAMWPGDDHRPETLRAWQQWAREHGIESLRDYILRSRREIDRMRGHGIRGVDESGPV